MPDDLFPDDLDFGQTVQIPRFGAGQKIFRRYTLQRILGRGGMGVVWLARDEQLESLVALKVLPETLYHDHASLDALKRETKLGLHLAHPNIVRIYDFQQDDNAAAISMEYVDGPTLSDLRITKPQQIFNTGDLLGYLEALCDALNYAHTREEIVHRDLKPRNLMLNSEGELKIADFGISRSISESLTLLTGMVGSAGSPPYISPQQWDGERPTALDDIYSVGATLYELLSGKPPLIGVVDWEQVHHRVPPPIWKRRLDFGIKDADPISSGWEETIAACLAKDPKDRPQTVRELQLRLTSDRQVGGGIAETTTTSFASPVETTQTGDSSDASFSAELTLQDVSDDTIVGTTRSKPRPESPAEAAVGTNALPSARAVREPGDQVQDEIFSPDSVKDALETSLISQDAETPPTTSISKEPPPSVTAPVDLVKPVAFSPLEGVTTTQAKTAFPRTEGERPNRPNVISSISRRVPRWVWAACAAIILLSGILLVLRKPASREPALSRFGDLRIESEPSGADFTLDGSSARKTPHTFKDLSFGTHRLTMTLEGYSPIEREIQFDAANPASKIILESKPKPRDEIAKLSVRSDPPGAVIRIDGTLAQEPPNTFTNVKFGNHHLTARLDGYEPKEQTMRVHGDIPNDIVLQLDRAKPSPAQDPLQAIIAERKGYEDARDWPKYRTATLELIRRLTTAGEPVFKEHREMLVSVSEGLRSKVPRLSPEEFRTYQPNLKYAAELDIVPAVLVLAENLRLKKSPEAFAWYYYAAENKHIASAMTKIAWLYWLGECGQQADKEQGLKWFKLAHAAGDTDAGVNVGKCYLRGDGTAKDEAEAIRILLPLAKAGVADAKTLIGQCYYNGAGPLAKLSEKERYQMAKTFFEEAVVAGDWSACGYLGQMYDAGKGVPKDWQRAARLYLQGVEHENPICMYLYAQAIEHHGPELVKLLGRQDEAETYYVKAAAASVPRAVTWCKEHNVKF